MGNRKSKVVVDDGLLQGIPERTVICELHGEASFGDHTGAQAISEIRKCGLKLIKYRGLPAMYTILEFKVEGTEDQIRSLVDTQYGWLFSVESVNPKRWEEN